MQFAKSPKVSRGVLSRTKHRQVQLLPLATSDLPARRVLVILQEAGWALGLPTGWVVPCCLVRRIWRDLDWAHDQGIRGLWLHRLELEWSVVNKEMENSSCPYGISQNSQFSEPSHDQVVPAEDLRKAAENASATVRNKKTASYL